MIFLLYRVCAHVIMDIFATSCNRFFCFLLRNLLIWLYLSISISLHLSISLSCHILISPSPYLYISLSIHVSIYLYLSVSLYLYIYRSIFISHVRLISLATSLCIYVSVVVEGMYICNTGHFWNDTLVLFMCCCRGYLHM